MPPPAPSLQELEDDGALQAALRRELAKKQEQSSSDEDEAPLAPADDSDTDLEEAGKKAEDVFVCRPGSGADTDGSDTDLSAAAPAPAADDSDTDLST